jgi:hypothetical protein
VIYWSSIVTFLQYLEEGEAAMVVNGMNKPPGAHSEITLWYRLDEKGEFKFNHFEQGHSDSDTPTPKVPGEQRGWSRGTWIKEHAWLDGNKPTKVLHDPEA